MKYDLIAIIYRITWTLSDSSFAFRVELLIERRRGEVFTLTIGVGGSDLFIDGGIDLVRDLLIESLIILVPLTGSGEGLVKD